jgi:hypothetical protein
MEVLMKMIVFVALLATAGCGSKKSGSDCEAAISKGIENLAPKVKMGATDPQIQEGKMAMLEKLKGTLVQRCIADKWAPEVLACFNTVANLTVMKVCQAKLTSEQHTKLDADLHEVQMNMMGGRMPGDMAGQPPGSGSGAPGEPGSSAAAPAGSAAAPAGSAAAPAPAGSAAPEPAAGSSAK